MLVILRTAYIATRLFLFLMLILGTAGLFIEGFGLERHEGALQIYIGVEGATVCFCFYEYVRARKAFPRFCSFLLDKWVSRKGV